MSQAIPMVVSGLCAICLVVGLGIFLLRTSEPNRRDVARQPEMDRFRELADQAFHDAPGGRHVVPGQERAGQASPLQEFANQRFRNADSGKPVEPSQFFPTPDSDQQSDSQPDSRSRLHGPGNFPGRGGPGGPGGFRGPNFGGLRAATRSIEIEDFPSRKASPRTKPICWAETAAARSARSLPLTSQ